jgi:hypothetical protein
MKYGGASFEYGSRSPKERPVHCNYGLRIKEAKTNLFFPIASLSPLALKTLRTKT